MKLSGILFASFFVLSGISMGAPVESTAAESGEDVVKLRYPELWKQANDLKVRTSSWLSNFAKRPESKYGDSPQAYAELQIGLNNSSESLQALRVEIYKVQEITDSFSSVKFRDYQYQIRRKGDQLKYSYFLYPNWKEVTPQRAPLDELIEQYLEAVAYDHWLQEFQK